jgi:hypothetical protein
MISSIKSTNSIVVRFTTGITIHHKPLTIDQSSQESFNSLRSRGGHGLRPLTAARFISRMATICRALSSEPQSFADPVTHHKPLMM